MKRLNKTLLASSVAIALSVGVANAAPVAGLFGSTTLLSDNSAEFLIDVNGSGTVDVGDILVGIVGLNSIESGGTSTAIGAGTGFNELTAFQAVKIASFTPLPIPPGVFCPNSQGICLGSYTATPLTAADAGFVNFATGQILGGAFTFTTSLGAANDGKTIGLVYEDAANNYTRDTTIQTGLTTSTDGTARLRLTLDTTVDAGDNLQVIAPVNLAQVSGGGALIPAATAIANTSISLDATIAVNTFPFILAPEITGGNGGFSSPTAGSQWPIFDNLDFTVTRVPEPGTLALLGLALAGIGASSRRNKKA